MTRLANIVWVSAWTFALAAVPAPSQVFPWESWKDPYEIARLRDDSQVLLTSSVCENGCREGWFSGSSPQEFRRNGSSSVVFDEPGAGAITHLFATTGDESSSLFPETARIRVFLDGEPTPRVDLPLNALFDGSTVPFIVPLVRDNLSSSGGFHSFVPIPYRQGCVVTLDGAGDSKIFFQFAFHRMASPGAIETFDPKSRLWPLRAFFEPKRANPWAVAARRSDDLRMPTHPSWRPKREGDVPGIETLVREGPLDLAPGEGAAMRFEGPGWITGIKLMVRDQDREDVRLRLTFDGQTTVDMTLADFFASPDYGQPAKSSLIGAEERFVYSYFPMPFHQEAELTLIRSGGEPDSLGSMFHRFEWNRDQPETEHGYFGANLRVAFATKPPQPYTFVELEGAGKLVGLAGTFSSVATSLRTFFDSYEALWVDDLSTPSWRGTRLDHFFGGAFGFDLHDFSTPLHGAPSVADTGGTLPEGQVHAYRFFFMNPIQFRSSLRGDFITSSRDAAPMRARTVAYYYRKAEATLERFDRLDFEIESDPVQHAHRVVGVSRRHATTGHFALTSAPATTQMASHVVTGHSQFRLSCPTGSRSLRLRRVVDSSYGGQDALIAVNHRIVTAFPPVRADPNAAFVEQDIDLPDVSCDAGSLDIEVRPLVQGQDVLLSELRYELWGRR